MDNFALSLIIQVSHLRPNETIVFITILKQLSLLPFRLESIFSAY